MRRPLLTTALLLFALSPALAFDDTPDGMDAPAFRVNPDPVGTTTPTWSRVKTLYR